MCFGVSILVFSSCKDGTRSVPKTETHSAKGFYLKTASLKEQGEYIRKSIIALLSGNSTVDGGLFDVEGYLSINSKPQCFLYLDKDSISENIYMNGILMIFNSNDNEKLFMGASLSGKVCRIRGEFRLKSEVDYGWSSGTIYVHDVSVRP